MREPRSELTDDTGQALAAVGTGARIVSLVPSITELICQLGAGDNLIGVSRFCTHPPQTVASIEDVGGTKNPDCERILALRPDITFVDREENRREDFERLVAAGASVFVANPGSVRGAARTVIRIGDVLARATAAAEIAAAIEAEISRETMHGDPPARVFCAIWRNPWMSFNATTYAADLIHHAGGTNVCQSATVYPVVTLEAIALLMPEVVLLPDEPYLFRASHIESMTELRATPAGQSGRIHVIDGKAMFWYGARTPAALRMLRALLR